MKPRYWWGHKEWFTGRPVELFASFDLTAINRPHLRCDWYDVEILGVTLEWSNGHSDPVWSASVTLHPPAVRLLARCRLIDRKLV